MTIDPTQHAAQAALYGALAKAQALAKAAEKDARNKHHGYDYTSAEGMIAEAKRALSQCALAVIPIAANTREPRAGEAPISMERGDVNKGARCVLVAEWAVVHEGGGIVTISCEWPVIPELGRPLDKALAAARTASLNYLLRDLLQLPRVEEGTDLDDDSRDQHADSERRPPVKRPPSTEQKTRVKALMLERSMSADDFLARFKAWPDSFEKCAEVIAALEKIDPTAKQQAATDATLSGATTSDQTAKSTEPDPAGVSLDGKTTQVLVLVKRRIDVCTTPPAVGIALAELADQIESLDKRPRLIARGYAAAVLKTLEKQPLTEDDQRVKDAVDRLVGG